MKNFNQKKVNSFAKNFTPKDLENKIKEVAEMLQELGSLDLSSKNFPKKADIISKKAKNLENNLKKQYKDILPKKDLDTKE